MAAGVRAHGWILLALIVGALLGAGAALLGPTARLDRLFGRGPDPVTIADASLIAVRREARMSVFAARFVVAITSEQDRFGLSARKTMIVPGTVRYVVNWQKLTRDDLRWDAATGTLTVRAPALEIDGPDIDLARIREYREGGILLALTDAERQLDAANRARAGTALLAEARAPELRAMARTAATEAVTRAFALPLAAAGVPARVVVSAG